MPSLPEQRLAKMYELRERYRVLDAQKSAVNSGKFKNPGELAKFTWPHVKRTPALDLLDSKLLSLAGGTLVGPDGKPKQRLAWSMPPQEGKSQRIARSFPLWMLLRNPDLRIAIASYSHTIARRWGRSIRYDIQSNPELGLRIRRDTGSMDEWQLDGFLGGVVSVGVGGSLTGRPVDLLIIDDPVKGRDEADSEIYRENAWDWWTETVSTRFAPGTPVVIDMTRWHQDDLMGRILAEQGSDWVYINIPAQADHDPLKGEIDVLGREPGEWMLSARGRTEKDWEQRRKDVGSRGWEALYQGRPAPADGGIFKRNWWQQYDVPRAVQQNDGMWKALGVDQVIASWDMTFKDTKGSDFVVGQVWGRRGTSLFLLDQVRGRWDFTETCWQVQMLHAKWSQAHMILVEDKANGPAVLSQLRSKVPGMVPVTPVDSKLARASAVAPFVEAGNVLLPSPELAPWIGDFLEECAAFPNVAHDDQVDAMTQAISRLMIGVSETASFMDELVTEKGIR